MSTDRVHSQETGTRYVGVHWNDVGNLRMVGSCYAGVSWNVVEHRGRLARDSRMSFVERCGTYRVTGTCDAGVIVKCCGKLA